MEMDAHDDAQKRQRAGWSPSVWLHVPMPPAHDAQTPTGTVSLSLAAQTHWHAGLQQLSLRVCLHPSSAACLPLAGTWRVTAQCVGYAARRGAAASTAWDSHADADVSQHTEAAAGSGNQLTSSGWQSALQLGTKRVPWARYTLMSEPVVLHELQHPSATVSETRWLLPVADLPPSYTGHAIKYAYAVLLHVSLGMEAAPLPRTRPAASWWSGAAASAPMPLQTDHHLIIPFHVTKTLSPGVVGPRGVAGGEIPRAKLLLAETNSATCDDNAPEPTLCPPFFPAFPMISVKHGFEHVCALSVHTSWNTFLSPSSSPPTTNPSIYVSSTSQLGLPIRLLFDFEDSNVRVRQLDVCFITGERIGNANNMRQLILNEISGPHQHVFVSENAAQLSVDVGLATSVPPTLTWDEDRLEVDHTIQVGFHILKDDSHHMELMVLRIPVVNMMLVDRHRPNIV